MILGWQLNPLLTPLIEECKESQNHHSFHSTSELSVLHLSDFCLSSHSADTHDSKSEVRIIFEADFPSITREARMSEFWDALRFLFSRSILKEALNRSIPTWYSMITIPEYRGVSHSEYRGVSRYSHTLWKVMSSIPNRLIRTCLIACISLFSGIVLFGRSIG